MLRVSEQCSSCPILMPIMSLVPSLGPEGGGCVGNPTRSGEWGIGREQFFTLYFENGR